MPRLALAARTALWLAGLTITGSIMLLAAAFLYLSPDLPSVDVLRDIRLQTPLRVYSADGALIGEFGEQRRTPVAFDQVPTQLTQAILAAEDHSFYEHHGVDLSGLVRATSQLLSSGRIQTGGSTITMQVARNYFLSHARTFSRKFNEILLAIQIERELSKEQILELYVNKIFLGNRAYGIEAAAQVYYGKPVTELDLAQLAMIAGLPKAPSAYNPIANPTRATERRNWILGRMHDLGYIDRAALETARSAPVTARYHGPAVDLHAGYVAEMVRRDMLLRYGPAAYTDGYIVYTTIDSRLQRAAQSAVVKGLLAYDQRHGYRGPERHLAQDPQSDYSNWLGELDDIPSYGGLRPAVITAVEKRHVEALLADGEPVRLEWDQGLSSARPYIDVNRRGPQPEQAADVVTVGDVVRLYRGDDERWYLRQLPEAQAALVSLEADTGAALSLVGGFDFDASKFNRVTQAQRQPGSAFKPFLYSAALEHGFTPASIINDAPVVFDDAQLEGTWRPSNDSGRFYGPTRLRRALYMSRNLVSIRLLRSMGISNVINYVERFGFDPAALPRDLSLALGSHAVTPLTLIRAYAVFANGGFRVEPYVLDRVENLSGEVLYQAEPARACRNCIVPDLETPSLTSVISQREADTDTRDEILEQRVQVPAPQPEIKLAERALDPRTTFIVDSLLRDVVARGTGRRARSLERSDVAGKTGTTNGPTDAWFSGYGGGVVTTAWFGFDQYQTLGRREYGGSAALPVWIEYMQAALQGRPERRLRQPEGIVNVRIDPRTGLRARPGQEGAVFEYFRIENVPEQIVSESSDTPASNGGRELDEEDIF